MISNRRYMLVVVGIILSSAIGIGLIIGIETGDGWRGLRATGYGIGGAVVVMGLLWLGGRGSGNHWDGSFIVRKPPRFNAG